MKRRSNTPFIITSVVLLVAGRALGAGKTAEDTSFANTASKLLLTVGVLALLVTTGLQLWTRRRTTTKT